MSHQMNIAHQDDHALSIIARFMWLCPILGLAAAAVLLRLFGATWWIAVLIALALACPSAIAWALYAEVSDPREKGNDGPMPAATIERENHG